MSRSVIKSPAEPRGPRGSGARLSRGLRGRGRVGELVVVVVVGGVAVLEQRFELLGPRVLDVARLDGRLLLLAALVREVVDHGADGEHEPHPLLVRHGVLVDDDRRDERRDLAPEADERAHQRAELRDRHEDEDLAHGAREAQHEQDGPRLLDHGEEVVDLVEHDEPEEREDRLPELDVEHQFKGADVVVGHDLVLVGARRAVEAQGHEEHDAADDHGHAALLVVAGFGGGAAEHEEAHARGDDEDVDVLLEGVALAEEGAHDHDGDGLAGLGQHLHGEDDVAEAPNREERRAHGQHGDEEELVGRHRRRLLAPQRLAHVGRRRVERRRHEDEAELVELSAARRRVLHGDAVEDEGEHDAEEGDGEPHPVLAAVRRRQLLRRVAAARHGFTRAVPRRAAFLLSSRRAPGRRAPRWPETRERTRSGHAERPNSARRAATRGH
mmetsp:Transcript_29762/g.101178  ORF Transcript_29762/g.101178 Transcript_29762/m.101178 type:complete len:441 (+) Transcript_29762:1078-2400(+)